MAKRDEASLPWTRGNPKRAAGETARTMTREQKDEARARAARAGRPYPNLVDNMAVIAAARKKSAS